MTGVRVGEAANPGPGQSRRRRRVSSSDDSDSHFDVGNAREGCAGRVPVDVLDALEEDLGVGEGEERVDAREDGSRNRFDRSECQGTVIDVDTDDEQSARAISDEDPVFRSVELGTVADSSIPVPATMPAESLLPTLLDGNQSPRCARDESLVTSDRDSEHVVAVRASSTAEAEGRMAVFTRSSGRPKRLRVVGHFHRISQTTTVPDPERLRDMEFDLTRGDSSSEEGSDSETEAWWGGFQPCVEDDYDTEIAVSSHAEVCPAPDHAVDCGRHAIPVSPATDPPIPIARVHVAVRCSQATTVGGGSPNSLDDAMDAETRPVA